MTVSTTTAPADLQVRCPVALSGRRDLLLSAQAKQLEAGLARLGWSISSIEVDAIAETAHIELRRGGRLVTFDVRNGSATTTRETVEAESVAVGRRGDRFRADRLRMRLLGRDRHDGLRSGLRALCAYIEHNSQAKTLPGEVRDLFRPLLSGGAS